MSQAISGNDTVIINSRVLTDFADADNGVITFPNGIVDVKKGKNDNAIFALNNQGKMCDMTLRLLRGSGDDKFMLAIYTQLLNNFPGFVLMIGQFIKLIGDGSGTTINDTYQLSSGVVSKSQDAKSNADGDTNQSVVEWHLKWARSARIIA